MFNDNDATPSDALASAPALTRTAAQTLAEQLAARFADRIRDRLLAPACPACASVPPSTV